MKRNKILFLIIVILFGTFSFYRGYSFLSKELRNYEIFFQKEFSEKKEISSQISEEELKEKIGQMIIVGFRGTKIDENSPIVRALRELNIGGVILYDIDGPSGKYPRNIINKDQLRELILGLQKFAKIPLFIAIDAEGGKVNRLKQEYGFEEILSHRKLGEIDDLKITKREAEKLARELKEVGINMNFAPVVDLNLNPQNPVISKLERSFSLSPQKVISHAEVFIKTFKEYKIVPVIKHFPGHGSSFGDSHFEKVDITNTFQEEELLPYKMLVKNKIVDAILVSHLYHKKIDKNYPASLSEKFLKGILRKEIGFKGIIISDDFQMKSISNFYSLKDILEKAINCGVNILLFSNNVSEYDEKLPYKIVNTILNGVKEGRIQKERILESYSKIYDLKRKYEIIK